MTTSSREGALRFLKAEIPAEDLEKALEVLTAFKKYESAEEWVSTPFVAWAKLEQFEDYLRLRTGIDADKVTDQVARKYMETGEGP